MSIKTVVEDAGILLLAAAIGAGIGAAQAYRKGVASETAKVAAAQAAQSIAESNAATLKGTLVDVQKRLDDWRATAQAAQQAAALALAQRDDANKHAAQIQRERITHDRKIAHETPDCAGLARLPLCPALARRLFPAAAPPDAGASTRGH